MDRTQELFGLFRECFPGILADEKRILEVFEDPDNAVFERREEGELQGVLILEGNTILLLCVRPEMRKQGLGSRLLEEAESTLSSMGFEEVLLYSAADHILPGAPMRPEISAFFEKRGYVHQGGENAAVDLVLELSKLGSSAIKLNSTQNNITYRWARPEDREAAVNCAGESYRRLEEYYWEEKIYDRRNKQRALIAVQNAKPDMAYDPAESVCGVLLVDMGGVMPGIGGLGCMAVRSAYAGSEIAGNLVQLGAQELKNKGMEKGLAAYAGEDSIPAYLKNGFTIRERYFLGKKELKPVVAGGKGSMTKEVYIQYRELEGRLDHIEQRIYDQFCEQGHQLSEIEKLQIYVKPQDFTAYYLINDHIQGKVGIF